MPLPYQQSKKLIREIESLSYDLYKVHTKQREAIDENLKSRLLEEIINYITPHVETIKMLTEKGLITSDWRGSGIKFKANPLIDGFGAVNTNKIREILGSNINYMELDPKEVINNKVLLEDLKKRMIDNQRMTVLCNNATSLANKVANSYGTVKYLLTQFPELRTIFTDDDPTWKPNTNYKVKPRSAFENNNAFILLFGEAAMFGIKP